MEKTIVTLSHPSATYPHFNPSPRNNPNASPHYAPVPLFTTPPPAFTPTPTKHFRQTPPRPSSTPTRIDNFGVVVERVDVG